MKVPLLLLFVGILLTIRLKGLQRINLNHNMTIHKYAFKESNYQSKFEEFLK